MSSTQDVRGWFAGRIPEGWFTGPPEVTVDADEVLVVGDVPEPAYPDGADDRTRAAARAGRAKQFREDTRAARMRIADEAEHRFGRKVSWGVTCGGDRYVFTNVSVPVMTRLRLPQRQVLDTLIEGGVARSRSEALAWCVRLVGEHEAEWLAELQDALGAVQHVRDQGPRSRRNP
jgi:hypothetical protein